MADIEPPSFSLGLDLDLEFESEPQDHPLRTHVGGNEEDFHLRVSDSDLDEPTPTLRRLRRGGPSSSKPISTPSQCSEQLPTSNCVADDGDDDDIQDFSSEELATTADPPGLQHRSLCSSSKLPLSGCGILGQQETKVVDRKRKQDSSCPSTSWGKSMLMDLTASPLRRFQLLDSDSDSDHPSESVHVSRGVNGLDFSKQNDQNKPTHGYHQSACEEKIKSSTPISKRQDLWKDFYSDKGHTISTPAFDEFCNEYFSAAKERKQPSGSVHELGSGALGKGSTRKMMQSQDLGSARPPSHCYFFHADMRIQTLVQSRLPYFHPLSTSGEELSTSSNASPIDYMSQFGHGDGAKRQSARQANVGKSSARTGKKSKKSDLRETSHASHGWVNPKQAASCPKDAGRRRVRAEGQSSGHWFTAENGKKVYVSRTGQELTGRLAYRSYKQESGRGFRRSKKKSASKKKK